MLNGHFRLPDGLCHSVLAPRRKRRSDIVTSNDMARCSNRLGLAVVHAAQNVSGR